MNAAERQLARAISLVAQEHLDDQTDVIGEEAYTHIRRMSSGRVLVYDVDGNEYALTIRATRTQTPALS